MIFFNGYTPFYQQICLTGSACPLSKVAGLVSRAAKQNQHVVVKALQLALKFHSHHRR